MVSASLAITSAISRLAPAARNLLLCSFAASVLVSGLLAGDAVTSPASVATVGETHASPMYCAPGQLCGQQPEGAVPSGPYCGINSLAVCSMSLGKRVDYGELISKEYIGSFVGSSADELVAAGKRIGVNCKTYANMSWCDLAESDSPLILHMRGAGASAKYDHWMAFLGIDERGMARIVDLPSSPESWPLAEVLNHWDGVAIRVSTERIDDMSSYTTMATLAVVFAGALVVLGSLLKHSGRLIDRFHRMGPKWAREATVILILSALVAVAYHVILPVGFCLNADAVADTSRRYLPRPDFSRLDTAQLFRDLRSDRKAVLIDARMASDYRRAHIPGARSIPVNSTSRFAARSLADVPKDANVIVYCHTSRCGYADEVAAVLALHGFENIKVYRDGYVEWAKADEAHESGSS